MKRMNIKSVFTHNNGTGSVKSDSGSLDSRNPSMESNDAHSVVSNGELSTSPDLQLQVCNSIFRTLDYLDITFFGTLTIGAKTDLPPPRNKKTGSLPP